MNDIEKCASEASLLTNKTDVRKAYRTWVQRWGITVEVWRDWHNLEMKFRLSRPNLTIPGAVDFGALHRASRALDQKGADDLIFAERAATWGEEYLKEKHGHAYPARPGDQG